MIAEIRVTSMTPKMMRPDLTLREPHVCTYPLYLLFSYSSGKYATCSQSRGGGVLPLGVFVAMFLFLREFYLSRNDMLSFIFLKFMCFVMFNYNKNREPSHSQVECLIFELWFV